jgi:hypothetical protein
MTSPCDLVAERLALGEPLGADGETHALACPACARLVRVPRLVAATARDPEPGPGFSSRMQLGARATLGARRRTRIMSVAAAAACACAVGTWAMTRTGGGAAPTHDAAAIDPWAPRQPIAMKDHEHGDHTAADRDVVGNPTDDALSIRLVRVADVDGALGAQAPWGRIETPLAPYRFLLDTQAREGGPR